MQHYVPKFYLENFTDPNGYIWVYEKGTGKCWRAKPENVAVERNLYSSQNKDGSYNDSLEKALADAERMAAPLIPKIERGEMLTGEEKEKFSLFAASVLLRTPTAMRMGAKIYAIFAGVVYNNEICNKEKFEEMQDMHKGKTKNENEWKARDVLWEYFKNSKNVQINIKKQAGLGVLLITGYITHILFRMNTLVITAEGQDFITSDNPFCYASDSKHHSPHYVMDGLGHENVVATLPISPDRMVVFRWRGKSIRGISEISRQDGKELNGLRASRAEKYLYASRKDPGIVKLAKKYPNHGLDIETFKEEYIPDINIVRKLNKDKRV